MNEQKGFTIRLEGLLDRWADGDESAIEDLIVHSQERLRRMASRWLANENVVGRWNQTDDLLQNTLVRLHRALKAVKPENKKAFIGLAATQIRRELIDLGRSLNGPLGQANNYQTDPGKANPDQEGRPAYEKADPVSDVLSQLEFHESVDSLEDDDRQVFELIFYQGMTQIEAAKELEVSERTIKRRWRSARLTLGNALKSEDENADRD